MELHNHHNSKRSSERSTPASNGAFLTVPARSADSKLLKVRRLLCLILLGVILSPGCGGKATTTGAGKAGATKPKVALIMKSLANEFFSTMAKGAESHQASSGEYELIVNGIKDERDLIRQAELVDEMVASGVDAIVIAPADSKALVPALRKAQQQGVVVVNIDNRLDADVLKQEDVKIPFVGPDNQAGARTVAEHLASNLEEGDSVLILEGIRTSFNGQQRTAGFNEAMKAAKLVVADSQSAEWEMTNANTVAASMLSEHPEAKAILAANDSMALGALAAVKSAGRAGQVAIVGFDNISAVQQAIRDGDILATVDQHGDELAVFGIRAALNILKAPDAKVDDVETPVDLITIESLAQ